MDRGQTNLNKTADNELAILHLDPMIESGLIMTVFLVYPCVSQSIQPQKMQQRFVQTGQPSVAP